jgi:hypothetical protein
VDPRRAARSGAGDIEVILAKEPEQPFGHLGARTITGAEEQDTQSVSHGRLLRMIAPHAYICYSKYNNLH